MQSLDCSIEECIMKIDDFTLARIVIEIRYDNAYHIWDKCGDLWNSASLVWPGILPTGVEPNMQSFRFNDVYEFRVEIDKAFMIAYYSKVKDVIHDQEIFIELVTNVLGIKYFNRVGARFFFEKECKDEFEVYEKFKSIDIVKIPKAKFFNIDGDPLPLEFSFKKENDDVGFRVLFKSASKKFTIEKPIAVPEFNFEDVNKNLLLYDIDYFTKKITNPGQLKISEWVRQIYHIIKRDSGIILGD